MNNPIKPEEIYENRIQNASAKRNRECRTDEDHLEALKLVYYAGYKKGKQENSMAATQEEVKGFFK